MPSTKSTDPEIDGGVTSPNTPPTSKILLTAKPRGSEVCGGVDHRHELRRFIYPGSSASSFRSTHTGRLASCDRESMQSTPLLGGGGSQQKGAPVMGPNIHPGGQAGCSVLLALNWLSQRGTWKSASGFLTPQIFSRICPRKGLKIALIGALRGG
jgi:hypothetical protein